MNSKSGSMPDLQPNLDRFPSTRKRFSHISKAEPAPLLLFAGALRVFASASNCRFVSGRPTVGTAVLAIRARLATAALVGTFAWHALVHMPSAFGSIRCPRRIQTRNQNIQSAPTTVTSVPYPGPEAFPLPQSFRARFSYPRHVLPLLPGCSPSSGGWSDRYPPGIG